MNVNVCEQKEKLCTEKMVEVIGSRPFSFVLCYIYVDIVAALFNVDQEYTS